jgi:hypothetical protein
MDFGHSKPTEVVVPAKGLSAFDNIHSTACGESTPADVWFMRNI